MGSPPRAPKPPPSRGNGAHTPVVLSCQATLKWSTTGHAVLVQTSTDVDSVRALVPRRSLPDERDALRSNTRAPQTGTSYYGSTALYLVHADGRGASQVQLGKDGPVHDFAWSPGGKEFVVVAGRMPPRAAVRYRDPACRVCPQRASLIHARVFPPVGTDV